MKPSDVETIAQFLEGKIDLTLKHRAALGAAFRADQTPEGRVTDIRIATILSQRTKQGMVEMMLNRERTQMDLDKAREIHRMLGQAIEAAVSDELLYRFLRDRVGMEDETASRALLDFRELRQGSREAVYPH